MKFLNDTVMEKVLNRLKIPIIYVCLIFQIYVSIWREATDEALIFTWFNEDPGVESIDRNLMFCCICLGRPTTTPGCWGKWPPINPTTCLAALFRAKALIRRVPLSVLFRYFFW